ncbi:hypothetical protein Zmor_021135 [Zophobas morio]|uniref:RING-type domain-containing protein n=1 Tax=Zophobas morio TaxID=2755281 RepID=A0AA38MAE2_9CUCU|nr:hypothetical protein Zmor_021135 [Zophobas morio]
MNLKDNCAICRVPMLRKGVARLLSCRHLFHTNCLQPLNGLNQDHVCPLCRTEVDNTEIIERKSYKKNSSQDRERIVTCANRGHNWTALATTLGINYKTASHWVHSGRPLMLQKGGIKPKVLTEQQIDNITEWVEEDSSITLKQLKDKVLQHFRQIVSISTIGNYLEGRIFTVKGVHRQSVSINPPENKRKRAEYVENLNRYIQQGKQIVWMDETNFNLFCRRTRGRARVGNRAVQHLPAARGPNVHLIGAISAAGVVQMERRRGSFTALLANEWVRRLLEEWQAMGNEIADLVLVSDNAPCHSSLEEAVNGTGATLLRLGPYSPMLNPIENIWSKIKTYAKTHLRVPVVAPPGVVEQRLV